MPISVVPRKNSTFAIGRLEFVGVAVAVSVIVAPAWNTAPLAGAVSEADIAHAVLQKAPAAKVMHKAANRLVPVILVMARLTE